MKTQEIVCHLAELSLPKRKRNTHKSDYGRVLIIGGSVGYTGAVSMCAQSSLRVGAGLVSVGVPEAIYPIVAVKLNEAMPFPMSVPLSFSQIEEKLKHSDVCIVGPGLGRSDEALQLARDVIAHSQVPTVIDADALFAIKDDLTILQNTDAPKILTPHEGEFLRLGGTLSGEPADDALQFAEKYGCMVVLKGPKTAIACPDGKVYASYGGNPGMATGGSGDVLAGMIGGLLGQLPVERAVVTGVCLHAAVGDLCAERLGEYSMLPTDMISAIAEVMNPMIGR